MPRPLSAPARVVGIALAAALALGSAPLAHAGSLTALGADTDLDAKKSSVDDAREKAAADLADTSKELTDAYAAQQAADAQLPPARASLAAARKALAAAQAKDADLARRLAAAQRSQRDAEARYGDAVKALDAADAEIGRLAADLYAGAEDSELSTLVAADDPQDVLDRVSMMRTVGDLQSTSVFNLGAARALSSAQQDYVRAVRAEVDRLKKESAAAVKAASAAADRAAAAERAVAALVAARAEATRTIEARKQAEMDRLKALDAESARLAKELAERAKARAAAAAEAARRAAAARAAAGEVPAPAPSGSGVLMHPVDAPLSSPFGQRYHPILSYWRLHSGQDFAAACGTPVRAATDGDVVSAGWAGGYGNRIAVDHGVRNGVVLQTTYNHLSSFVVRSGHVTRGQVIGYSGTTGLSTGCHLHFEALANGSYVNPAAWF